MAKEETFPSPAPSLLEPGDRFALAPTDSGDQLAVPSVLGDLGEPIERIEDPSGKPLTLNRVQNTLILGPVGARDDLGTLWLEFQARGRFRLVHEAVAQGLDCQEVVTEQGVHISLDPEDLSILRSVAARTASLAEFQLAMQAARLQTHAGFDRLICLPLVRDMELLEHQIRTAKTVLHRFRGRALLCDEVGLGKTIEAGLIFSELKMRGLIRSALVLVPPSLLEQWQGEMRRKFSLDLTSHDAPAFRERGAAAWNEFDLVIASIHTAKREPHRSAILARQWDLVVMDEAHHLRNRTTQLWKFASELQKQFILLLTATPVQNNLEELYNLVTLLEPGLLRTAKQFSKQFVDRKDKLTPRNLDELHRLLAEVGE